MNRLPLIRKYCKNKKVLNIGCVGAWRNDPHWVHGIIDEVSSEVVGIDIDNKKIEKIREEGWEVYQENAENFSFDRNFEVIVAGELIEHLSNPGLFLDSARNNLTSDGQLLIDTPNYRSLQGFLGNLLGKGKYTYEKIPYIKSGHVVGFTTQTLMRILKRHNYQLLEMRMVDRPPGQHSVLGRALNKITPSKFKSQIFVRASPK